MKKQTIFSVIFSLIVVLLILGISACSSKNELTPSEILDKSTTAMKNVKTLHLTLDVTSSAGETSITITGEGVAEQPDKAYIKMTAMGQNIEVLTLNKSEVYMKMPNSTTWEPIPAEQLSQSGISTDMLAQLQVSDIATDPKLVGTEKVGSIDCYHVSFGMDMNKYVEKLGQAASGQIDPATAKASGEMWIGKSDFLIYKFHMALDATVQGTAVTTSTDLQLGDFDKPVNIPQP